MDHAAVVRRRQPGAQLGRRFDSLVRRKAADAREQRRQVFAVHVLHGEERHALHFADIVNAAHVGVGDQPRHPHLAVEPLEQPRIPGRFLRKELQRHGLPQGQVRRTVHLPHAAAAHQPDDPVTPSHQGSGRKTSLFDHG